MLYQLSYEATHWERGQFIEFISPMRNLLQWSFFTLVYNRSSNIWIISYILHIISFLLMCGFIAQLVEHRTGIVEVTGSNPVEALVFFRLLLSNILNWTIIILHVDLQPQFNIWIISYMLYIFSLLSWVHISREEWNDVKYIWKSSYIWSTTRSSNIGIIS